MMGEILSGSGIVRITNISSASTDAGVGLLTLVECVVYEVDRAVSTLEHVLGVQIVPSRVLRL